jgi:hypothetical protein
LNADTKTVDVLAVTRGHQCKRPAIANFDYSKGFGAECQRMVNRTCLTCETHWFGDSGVAVFEMPKRVWERWIESAAEVSTLKPKTLKSLSCANCDFRRGNKCHSGEFEDYEAFPLSIALTDFCEMHSQADRAAALRACGGAQ